MNDAPSESDLYRAWEELAVTTPFQKMVSCPAQKAILVAIARNKKKRTKKECYDYAKNRFPD